MDCRLPENSAQAPDDAPVAASSPPSAVIDDQTGAVLIDILRPRDQTLPVVLASPHSGRHYPDDFLAGSRLDARALRQSEDGFVDEIFADAVGMGAPMLRAHFPRAYLDVNREPYELDPGMFADPLPSHANTRSPRVAAGLGTIARIVAHGQEIYRGKLTYAEAQRRIDRCHRPYHQMLTGLLDETRAHFGYALLIDCHSMPSTPGPALLAAGGQPLEFVLGDLHGQACGPVLTETAARWLRGRGYGVDRNNPYAGGYTTRHYGHPDRGVHALQIEISRALYMDEKRMRRKPYLTVLAKQMADLVETLGRIAPAQFLSARAG